MAKYKVVIELEGSRLTTIQKELEIAFGDKLKSVRKVDLAKSRADRLTQIQEDVQASTSDLEDLIGEMQEWYDSIPENLQDGEKASQV